MGPDFRFVQVLGVLGFLYLSRVQAACPSVSGQLQGLEHDIAGTISIAEDCTLSATKFSYDGAAPQVFWWGAPSCDVATIKKEGFRISEQQLENKYNNGELTGIPLRPNTDWSKVGCIIIYCEEFYADLGHLKLDQPLTNPPPTTGTPATPTPTPGGTAGSPPATSAPAYETVQDLPNCAELIPGYYNLHWAVQGETITIGLEGRPGGDNRWIGFGFSAPGAAGPEMVGSNAIVAGMIKGKCFTYNYILSSQSQCDFATGDGACPDFAGKAPLVPSTSAELIACEKEGDKLSFLMTRPLTASDGRDNAWPTDGSQFAIYAMGPVSEGSNSTLPVVLYHNLQLPGMPMSGSVNSNLEKPIKLNFGATGNNCRQIVPMADAPASAPAAEGGKVATINGPTTFNITIGSNKNYPNPPAWGYSLWVNGQESPVLVVERGKTYTFNVAAGPTHPVYITSSIIGGGLLVDYAGETIFAGNDTTFGSPDDPVTFQWKPKADTPDLVYYQCAVHQKLGWQIEVVDKGAAAAPAPIAAPAPAPSGSKSACVVTVSGTNSRYEACLPLEGIGSNYNMAWNLTTDPANPGSSIISMALNATSDGYIAVGFPKTPGKMVGSYAMVLKACSTCASGAEITEYYLGAQTTSGVKPNSELKATDTSASAANGVLSGKFQLILSSNSNAGNRRRQKRRSLLAPILDAPLTSFPLIFSAGSVTASGGLQMHDTRGSSSVDLAAAQNDDGSIGTMTTVSTGSTNRTARRAHMWLMAISFGFLMPIGVIIARWGPLSKNPKAFQLHRAIQTLAFLAGCGGIAAGFIAADGWNTPYYVHRDIGLAVLAAFTAQVLSLVLRPSLESKLRRPWVQLHRWVGRAGLLLAIANIYYGIIHVADLDTWAWAAYTAVLGALVVVILAREIWSRGRGGEAPKNEEQTKLV